MTQASNLAAAGAHAQSPGNFISSGTALSYTSATNGGTTLDFTIPTWVKRITVMLNSISTNGTTPLLIQLGTAGGIVSSGYASTCGNHTGAVVTDATNGFIITASSAATDLASGNCYITNINSTNWTATSALKKSTTQMAYAAGDGAIGAAVTTVRLTTSTGVSVFDGGTVNILYEG